jgi:heptaprenyl diphosphate synthase
MDMMMKNKTAQLGLLLAVALILSYIESLFPFAFGIPGMKLGLPNLAVVLSLTLFGWREALIINIARILVSGFMFGSLYGILFSMAGAMLSFLFMMLARQTHFFSVRGISVCGGVTHNIGQLLIAVYVVNTGGILYYLPALIAGGTLTGLIIGIVADLTEPHIRAGLK